MTRLADDHVITINDCRRQGLCVRGLSQWAKDHGKDIRVLAKTGIRVDEVRALNDGYGQLLLERLEKNQ